MNEKVICYDVFSDRYFKASLNDIQRAINIVNCKKTAFPRYRTTLNDIYEILREEIADPWLSSVEVGDMLGYESYKKTKMLIDVGIYVGIYVRTLKNGETYQDYTIFTKPRISLNRI